MKNKKQTNSKDLYVDFYKWVSKNRPFQVVYHHLPYWKVYCLGKLYHIYTHTKIHIKLFVHIPVYPHDLAITPHKIAVNIPMTPAMPVKTIPAHVRVGYPEISLDHALSP